MSVREGDGFARGVDGHGWEELSDAVDSAGGREMGVEKGRRLPDWAVVLAEVDQRQKKRGQSCAYGEPSGWSHGTYFFMTSRRGSFWNLSTSGRDMPPNTGDSDRRSSCRYQRSDM